MTYNVLRFLLEIYKYRKLMYEHYIRPFYFYDFASELYLRK